MTKILANSTAVETRSRMTAVQEWFTQTFIDPFRQLRWSFLPPLMVYFAAGIAGLTSIVGTFFVKEYLGLSAAFLAALTFWAGLPWALKMPLGHLVDLIWRWKALLVYLGAALIAASLGIMYALIMHTEAMRQLLSVEAWFVVSSLLAPAGYVVQDTVADAMSVEAVPRVRADGQPLSEEETKGLHTTMQTLGRIALIAGLLFVALLNIVMFAGVESLEQSQKADVYARIYLMAFAIPLVSVSGVLLSQVMLAARARQLREQGVKADEADRLVYSPGQSTEPNYWMFGGGAAFVALTLAIGISDVPLAQEIVFCGSMAIITILIYQLVQKLPRAKARALIGTALIIFVFRAVPLPGAGATWFMIDQLHFDQQFLSVLSLIASCLTLLGMVLLRPLMASRSIAYIVVLLTLASGVLALPNIGLYYGVQDWTARLTGGVVDAHFIAIVETTLESPLGQVAMIPLLTWIARNAPADLKATFFAVMASFTNMALTASSLLTKYLNQIFLVTREVRDRATGTVQLPADYSQLGWLLITVALIGVMAPLVTVLLVQRSRLQTRD
jgi:MFS family permease